MSVDVFAIATCDRCKTTLQVPAVVPDLFYADKPTDGFRVANGQRWYIICPPCNADFEEFMTNAR